MPIKHGGARHVVLGGFGTEMCARENTLEISNRCPHPLGVLNTGIIWCIMLAPTNERKIAYEQHY
jgi:hypothetical protein